MSLGTYLMPKMNMWYGYRDKRGQTPELYVWDRPSCYLLIGLRCRQSGFEEVLVLRAHQVEALHY